MANKNVIIKNRNGDNCFPYTFDFNVFTANYERLSDIIPNLVPKILTIAGINLSDNISANDLKNALINSFSKLSADLLADGTINKVFTDTEKTKLNGIEAGAEANDVTSVNGKTGAVVLNASDVGAQSTVDSSHKLSADVVDDTSTTNKFVTTGDKNTWNGKQNTSDNSLNTTNKNLVSAINEVNSIAKGASVPLRYYNYSTMIAAFNALDVDAYNVGQNIMIVTLEVPDLWISSIEETSVTYTYTTDSAFTTALATDGYVQVGYYKLSALETQKVNLIDYVQKTITIAGVDLQDSITDSELRTALNVADGAQVNTIDSISTPTTTLIITNKNAAIPYGAQTVAGVIKVWTSLNADNELGLNISTE